MHKLVREIAKTPDIKEAYNFANLLNLTDGVFDVKVDQVKQDVYQVSFEMVDIAIKYLQIFNITKAFDLSGLEFVNPYWINYK